MVCIDWELTLEKAWCSFTNTYKHVLPMSSEAFKYLHTGSLDVSELLGHANPHSGIPMCTALPNMSVHTILTKCVFGVGLVSIYNEI